MDRTDIIRNTLNQLIEQDYREGFEDGVIYRVRAALEEFDGSGKEFWSYMCSISQRKHAFTEFFNSDQDLWDLYYSTEKMSKGPGSYVPHPRETYGT